MIHEEEIWGSILAAYRRGETADYIWTAPEDSGNDWGTLWTIPPRSVAAAERAARQISRMRARRLRHARRARLRWPDSSDTVMVVVVTVFPDGLQRVRALTTGTLCKVPWLEDEVLRILRSSLA